MSDFKPKLLGVELVMFFAVQMIALFVGSNLARKGIVEEMQGPSWSILSQFIIAFAIAIALMLAAMYFLKTPRTFAIFFAFLIFIGTNIVFSAFFPDLIAIPLAIAVVAIRLVKPNLITHNIAIFLTIAGVAAYLGATLRSHIEVIIILLIALSIYDYIAVFKTGTMLTMFKHMLQRGAPFAIIVPESPKQFGAQIHKVSKEKLRKLERADKRKSKFLMLGTGDLAFPAVFAVAALTQYNLATAFAIITGAMVGIVVNHYYLTQKYRAIPALPAIAFFSIIAFVISQLPSWI